MRPILPPLRRILLQILLLLGCYFLSRCVFTVVNRHHFEGLGISDFLKLAFYGLRYDISGILVVNALYVLMLLLPVPLWKMPRWERFTQWLFIAINAFALLFEVSDWAYYPYNFKRSTADVLNMVSRKGDFWSLLPGFLVDYWYVPLGWMLLVLLLVKMNNRIRKATPLTSSPDMSMHWIIGMWQFVRLVLVAGLMVIGIRGGTQYIPVGIRNAVQVTESKYAPIVLNTPFSIVNTFANDKLPDVHYLPDTELEKYFNPVKQYTGKPFSRKNVVLIILESFSKEFTGIGGRQSYTPFLDSLMQVSYTCTQAYANGLHSAEGIPAVVSGLPSLMDEPITTSVYGANRITALPGLLKQEGYQSAFYHGGTNGTMSFDVYCAAAGFDKYFGRSEYSNEKDYDGNWGIWDEPFLQYFAQGVSRMKEPFVATVFTLSSHPPYNVPDAYKNVLPKGTLPIHQCIAYSDQALRKFFAAAAAKPWYRNTVFVITPDHCSPMSGEKYYQGNMGQYAIPVIFFAPGDTALRGHQDSVVQQLDIMPSVLDYLGYNKKFFAWGNSVFRNGSPHFVINSISDTYQLLMSGYLLQTTDVTPRGLYAFPQDSSCAFNLVKKEPAATQRQLQYLEAFIQAYRNALNRNRLVAD